MKDGAVSTVSAQAVGDELRSPAAEDCGVHSPYGDKGDSRFTLARLLEATPPDSREFVQKAYELASRLHEGQTRSSGEPYVLHPLIVATYIAELNLDGASIAAGLLHDVLEDTEITFEELRQMFPEAVAQIVKGVTKISKINFQSNHEAQVENLRTMILAMAQDIRVVIVKLCDRLHNMQTLRHLPEERRFKISQETLDIYAPLANRLGIFRIKSEMEDLAMRWLHPREYNELAQKIAKKRGERENIVNESVDYLRGYLGAEYEGLEIYGRPKHFFSIYKKMLKQSLTFDQIYDLTALRIIADSPGICYGVMGLIHKIWPPLPNRIKDYIGMPKKNMYQSIHTTVIGLHGEITEIQIRTREMHQIAEFGIAAHWKYKENRDTAGVDDRLVWLRQLTEWIMDEKEPDNLLEGLKKDVFADRALCFTPQGDVVELPAGATPIDFAYAIHTKIGEHCVGAKINRRMVNLRSSLNNGDVVEILTSQSGHPSRDWLEFAVTGRARSKIKHWLKTSNRREWVDAGRAALLRVIKERNIKATQGEVEDMLEEALPAFKMQDTEDLLVEVGFGSIGPQALIGRVRPEWIRVAEKPKPAPKRRAIGQISVQGLDHLSWKLAACCAPIPGDPIIGFITRGRGVTIHHRHCRNVQKIIELESVEAGRLVEANWNRNGTTTHTATVRIEAEDRGGLLLDVAGLITRHNIFILGVNTRSYPKRGVAVLRFDVNIEDVSQLDRMLDAVRRLQGILTAERVARPLSASN